MFQLSGLLIGERSHGSLMRTTLLMIVPESLIYRFIFVLRTDMHPVALRAMSRVVLLVHCEWGRSAIVNKK